jgi:hypothetical protein
MTSPITAREEFLRVLRAHHGVYLDAVLGFSMVRTQIQQAQQASLAHGHPTAKRIEELDEIEMFVGDKDPARYRVEHVAKMGWFKERNSPGGLNRTALANLIVVSIFSFWEDHYRERVAAELSLEKQALLIPVIGDIRLLRNDIVHHAAIATERIARCEVLKWFKPGDLIVLTPEQIDEMVVQTRTAIRELRPASAA